MPIDSQVILILSALGSINGLLVALYLWMKTSQKLANRFLAVMLIMISIRTLKSAFLFFNPQITKTILQIGLSSCFLIGPLLYFFCLSHLNKLKNQILSWKVHLLLLVSLIVIFGGYYPYTQNEELWRNEVYKTINYTWLFYIVLSLILITPTLKALYSLVKVKVKAKLPQEDIWLLSIFTGNFFIWLAYYTASYTSYIVGALSFSFVLFIIGLLVLFKSSQSTTAKKYANKKIEQDDANEIIERLNDLMKNEALYKNSLISMPQVAKRLGMPTPKFSQLLNDNLNKSFSVFINEYRIEAAKVLLCEQDSQSIEMIAEQCGFNSQSTFYSAFKKITSQTPAVFKAENSPKL